MNGIEKITGRICEDVQQQIDLLLGDARRDADDIRDRYARLAEKEGDALLERGRKAAAERVERLGSVAQLEGRKTLLATKQAMVSRAFDQALERLCALPDEQYIDLLAALAVKAARTGREQVIFSQKDRNRVGKAVVTRANEILAKRVAPKLSDELTETKVGALIDKVVAGASALLAGTGMLTLAEGTRPMKGGVVLSDGEVETNCSFETLVRLQREVMSTQVAKTLFD